MSQLDAHPEPTPVPHDAVDVRGLVLDVHDRGGTPFALVDLGRETVNVWAPTRRMGVRHMGDPTGSQWVQYLQLFTGGPLTTEEIAEAQACGLNPAAYPTRTVRALCRVLGLAMADGAGP